MNQPAIAIKHISKGYYIEKPKTLKKWFKIMFHPFNKYDVFKNFSLIVNRGEFVLITGPNGCGKTTLLKLIAGITGPDKGEIKTFGRVVPLIELGAGFNYELTGRENIITNATILGIEKRTITRIIPDIIKFADLHDFIDIPVKRYSTGMVSRLAFSIAVYSEPEILLLDEIFAVGDIEFREKAMKRLAGFKKKGVTVIISSHYNFELPIVDKKMILKKNV